MKRLLPAVLGLVVLLLLAPSPSQAQEGDEADRAVEEGGYLAPGEIDVVVDRRPGHVGEPTHLQRATS